MYQDSVLVKEIKTDFDRNKKPYTIVVDGGNNVWRLFGEFANTKLDLNKGYLFKYEINGEYKNVKAIEKLDNVFVQKALVQTANINDIKRDINNALGHALVYTQGANAKLDEVFNIANDIYVYITDKANKELPKEEN